MKEAGNRNMLRIILLFEELEAIKSLLLHMLQAWTWLNFVKIKAL